MKRRAILVAGLAATAALPVAAQAAWPTRPVTVVFPYPGGGNTDQLARELNAFLQVRLGQAFVTDNRPGATGMIGTQAVMRAAADGYTLLVATSSQLTAPLAMAKPPYDLLTDLEPVAPLVRYPGLLVVPPRGPATFAEWVSQLRAGEPRFYGTVGPGSLVHLITERVLQSAGLRATAVPYRTLVQAETALMGGEIHFLFDAVQSAAPYVQANRLRALAVTSRQRAALLPDVPTLAEAGGPAMVEGAWIGLFAPRGTPGTVLQKLRESTLAFLADRKQIARLVSSGIEPMPGSAEDLRAVMKEDHAKWSRLIRELNLRLE